MRMTALPAAPAAGYGSTAPAATSVGDIAVEVNPVDGRRALREFVGLPFRLYTSHSHWVPPLRREEMKFLSSAHPYVRRNPTRLFLARKRGEIVGRIAATVCEGHNATHGELAGFFGFFECEGEPATATALLEAAAGFLREQGMQVMQGPFNFTTNHTCGLLVEGFDGPPVVDMPYNPPSYAELLEAQGLVKAKDLVAYWIDLEESTPEREALAAAVRQAPPRYRVRDMHLKGRGLRRDMETFYDLYHHAWRDNWGFVPLDREEYDFLLERLRPAMAPGFSHVAEVDGKPAGMFLGIPDLHQVLPLLKGRLTPHGLLRAWWARRRVEAARLLLTGIYDDYRGTPVAALLLHRCLEGARARGCRGMEISWVLEDNEPANRFFRKHGLRVYRRYRIYERPIGLG